jgi:hypothetical protein
VVVCALGALVLDCPAEVRYAERHRSPDGRELCVVDEDDSLLLQEPARVDEVEEHAFEPVVAVEEGEIELPAFAEEARQDDLRFLGVELDEGPGRLPP